VAIVDWDVHHGNGTQEMFYRDPSVLYVSTHQWPFYPGTGAAKEIGEGEGAGATVNVPLSAGGDDTVYRSAFERVILPVLEEYRPELVLVSAGFDPAIHDPLAQMVVSDDGFGWMGRALARVADRHAASRIALVLEGGYDLPSLEGGLEAAVRGIVLGEAQEPGTAPDSPDVARAERWAARAGHRI
jgi:acetoin utilization deacetylase AcuC-like enzyme